jgi:ankyrin repeat protein
VKLLLERNADANAKDNNGHTALELAHAFGKQKCEQILKNHDESSTNTNSSIL